VSVIPSSAVVAIASEGVWVAGQFSLDLLSDDMLVAVQTDGAGWWTWSTSWTHFSVWAWWTLSAWDAGNTSWAVSTPWTSSTVSTSSTGIADQTGFTSGTWLTWFTFSAAVTWSSVHAWVTWSAGWAWKTFFTGSTSLTLSTSLAWLTIFTWVTVSSVWTWNTSATWFTNWTASGSVWTGWTWLTSWTLATWGTSFSLSTVWSNIVRAKSVFTVGTSSTWVTGGTIHTTSSVSAWVTLSAWDTWLTWNTWWTHWTHWTFLLFTLAFAFSGSAFLFWGFASASVVNFGDTVSVPVWLVSGTDSVSGGDVSLKEVEVWAARQASFLFGTLGSDGVNHNVDFGLSEVQRSSLDGSQRSFFDDTGVGHDHENSSSVFGFGAEVVEHIESAIKTFGDVVTMSHVGGVGDGAKKASFFVDAFEGGDDFSFGGVSNNTDSDSALVFSKEFLNHGLGGAFHASPVFFNASSGVHENDDFDWAWYFWNGVDVIATSTGTFGQIKTAGGSDGSDLMVGVLFGGSQHRSEGNKCCEKPHVLTHRD